MHSLTVGDIQIPIALYHHHFVTNSSPAKAEFVLETQEGLMSLIVTWPSTAAMERDLRSLATQMQKVNEHILQ
jgi:hypothetical protein